MVSSVSFPQWSTKQWPTKVVVESGRGSSGAEGAQSLHLQTGESGPLPWQADRHPNHIPQTDRWISLLHCLGGLLPHCLDRWMGTTPVMSPRQTDRHSHHLSQTDRHPCHLPQTDSCPPAVSHGGSKSGQSMAPVRVSLGATGGMGDKPGGTLLLARAGACWLPQDAAGAMHCCTCELPLHGEAEGGLPLGTRVLLGPLQG